jgi:RimJ/RimL family protein N-acetyltransferase
MIVKPITLEGEAVRLEPLSLDHLPALADIGLDERLWKWTANFVRNANDMEAYGRAALADQEHGVALPFVTVDRTTSRVVGSTRFGNIDRNNRKVEIGWTWVSPHWQRTAINTEAKLLMLTHAFEVWDCMRVEFKTDANNEQSRNAIRRIGAVEEGVLRNHMITDSGRYRDSVYFSIIDSEWPVAKSRLIGMMAEAGRNS